LGGAQGRSDRDPPGGRAAPRLVLSLAAGRLILSSLAERSVGYQSWSV
jgi:hypothetical protein